jgi:hypothetical protein
MAGNFAVVIDRTFGRAVQYNGGLEIAKKWKNVSFLYYQW